MDTSDVPEDKTHVVGDDSNASAGGSRRKEIYTHQARWPIYGLAFCNREGGKFRLALGSFIEEYNNKIEIVQLNENEGKFVSVAMFDHPYPCTKVLWSPDKSAEHDMIGTTGDYLRLWTLGEDGVRRVVKLDNNKNSEFCAPLTSFDWNETDPNIVGTSSIDTTCTIWDIQAEKAKTQLIAHDRDVYDIAFHTKSVNEFASVGADGSVRMFDLRSLDHSTIMYEAPQMRPLLRLSWNRQDPNYMATVVMDSPKIVILDVRMPSTPVAELSNHKKCANAIAWAPHSSCHICTAGDDCQALIWDLSGIPKPITEPILAYNAGEEVTQLQWSSANEDWISISYGATMQILRV